MNGRAKKLLCKFCASSVIKSFFCFSDHFLSLRKFLLPCCCRNSKHFDEIVRIISKTEAEICATVLFVCCFRDGSNFDFDCIFFSFWEGPKGSLLWFFRIIISVIIINCTKKYCIRSIFDNYYACYQVWKCLKCFVVFHRFIQWKYLKETLSESNVSIYRNIF